MSMSIPNNEIWVKTSDNHIPRLIADSFNVSYVNTTSQDGWYIFHFDGDITTIGSYAINGDVYITDIILPETVTHIGKNAFNGDSGLKNINFPESLYSINSGAFSYCTGLTSLEFKHVVQIDTEAFMGCYNLTDIEWGDSLYRIGQRAFYSNNMKGKLKTLTIPATVGAIDPYAFSRQGIENLFFLGKTPPQIGTGSFANNTISTVTVPYVGKDWYTTAFASHTTLSGATIYYTLENSIPDGELWVKSNSIPNITLSGFTETLLNVTQHDNGWVLFQFDAPLTKVGDYAFYQCKDIEEIILPSTVKVIGDYAFREIGYIDSKVEEIILPSSVESIGRYAFAYSCIKRLVLNSNEITLKNCAFYTAYFDEVEIHSLMNYTYTSVYDDRPFTGCSGHLILNKNQNEPINEKKHIFGGASFSGVTFGNDITTVYDYFQYNNTKLELLNFSNSIVNIGNSAFYGCKSLKEIIIPDSVKDIGEYAFYSCRSVNKIHIGTGLKIIKYATFSDVAWDAVIKELVIPDNIEIIEETALSIIYCDKIIIGKGVKSIGNHVFSLMRGLNTIEIHAKIAPIIGKSTFSDLVYSPNGTLYYPQGADYSLWLSTNMTYLGYWGWNGIELEGPVFTLEYYSLEVPQIGMITTLDVTSSQITEILIEYPWWAVPKQKDDYFEIDIEENDGLPRTGEMIFTAISEDGERITQTLTINQKGIEDMATSIALYKTRLDFPAEGGSKYVQVDYINASVINAPYCSQSWVTIEQTQAGTAVDGNNTTYQRMYKITMESAPFARQINVKFSCTSPTGAEISTDKLMLYQAAPTVNPDDGEGTTEVHPYSTIVKVKIDGTPEYSSGSNLGVGYENLTPSTPDVDSSWIHLGVGVKDDGVSSYDTVMRYPVTYDENEGPERTGYITFKGIDGAGNVYTATTEVTQYGTDTPVDEGMIELQSLSMTLPAEGGSDNFVVKYYDAKTIYDPEFVGDWATITEVSTTSENGVAFNGTECVVVTKTYKVTAQPTTTGRVAKVILRADINYYDGGVISMEKDKFRVNQLASGSDELQGIVYPFRNTVSFNHKGLAESWSSVKVGYKDLAVDTPQVSVDWFRVKSVTDKTYGAKEYDYIYEYELEVDENIGTMREGTITFIGNAEDGTRNTSVVKVIQLGYESDIDTIATNYKGYFKSVDGALYSVAFVTNPNYDSYGEITLAGESPVVVSYTDSETLYEPVRTSTCTVRVISTQYLMNLYSGKAQGTQVIVKNEDTDSIEWCGFLQPNLYNQGYSNEIEEIEFEASDCLSTLQYLKYEDYYSNGRMSVPFSYIIADMLDKTKLIKSYYMTEKFYEENDTKKTLKFNQFYISEHNFFSEEDEPWTLLEVLEEICKFFGYVCYQWGDSIYFMDYDQYTDTGKMRGYRYDKSSNWNTGNLIFITEDNNTITSQSYRQTGADMSLDDIFNKVSVNCNYYNIEDIIPDLFDDELLTNRIDNDGYLNIRRYSGRGNSVLANQTYYRLYNHRDVNQFYYSPITTAGSSIHETKVTPTEEQMKKRDIIENFVGANIVDMIHLSYNEANGKVGESKDWERYLLISQLNRPWCGHEGTFHWEDYNFPIIEFKNIPTIFVDNTQSSTGRPGVKTKPRNYFVIDAQAAFTPILDNSFLNEDDPKGMKYKSSIDCYIYEDAYNFDETRIEPALSFYLEIPSKGWWNGSGWVDYKTHFEVPLEKLDREKDFWNTNKSVENTVESNLFLGSAGYKIPLPAEMDSTEFMYFAIGMPRRTAHLADSYGGDYTGEAGNAYCFIKDLKMSIQNAYSTLYAEKDEIIENIIDEGNVIEGPEIELKITSDNGQGYSLSNVAVMGTGDKLTSNFDFYSLESGVLKPEMAIIEKYVNQYSTPSVKENVTVDMSFKPYQLIKDSWWDKQFILIGQEIDFKESRQTISLLEKK